MNQAERIALIRSCLPPPPRTAPPAREPEPTEEDALLADGFCFTVDQRRREASATAHRTRRRIADREVAARDRVHSKLADLYGADQADGLM